MKNFLKKYCYSYSVSSIAFIVLSLIVKLNFNNDIPFIRISIGNIFISGLIALSWTIFKMKKGNQIIKTIIGFIILLPILIFIKRMFGLFLFKASFALFILFFIIAIIYSAAVILTSKKAKKEVHELNNLLKK